jgi:hypothetical protein
LEVAAKLSKPPPAESAEQHSGHKRYHESDCYLETDRSAKRLGGDGGHDTADDGINDPNDHRGSGDQVHQANLGAEVVGLEHTGLIVVVTGDEVGIQLRFELEIGLAESVHSRDEPDVLDVGLDRRM